MNVTYDKTVDCAYFGLTPKRKVAWTEPLKDWLMVDYDKNGKLLGVEVLFVSEHLPDLFGIKGLKSGLRKKVNKVRQLA